MAELMEQLIKSSEERGKYTLVVQQNSLCGASRPFSDQPVRDRSDDLRVSYNLITKTFSWLGETR